MTIKLPLAPAVNYGAVGRCVYCGTTTGRLTDEHIIPRGLNGNLILPAASCDACAKITSEIEGRVLRGFLERGRQAIGVSSRHKKRVRLASLPTTFMGADESIWEKEIPVAGSFLVMHLPVFIPPLYLGGISKNGNLRGLEISAIDTLHIGNARAVMREHEAVGIRFKDSIDLMAFARMLGKIAHCYYIAQKGWFPLEESPVLPIVMGKSDLAKEWIGCLEDAPLEKPGSKALHLMDIADVTVADGSACSFVRVKLFSPTSGPTYAVVTRIRSSVSI